MATGDINAAQSFESHGMIGELFKPGPRRTHMVCRSIGARQL
jgi:hypothetical protein